jgi:hypothetical protein
MTDDRAKWEAIIRGRLCTLLGCNGDRADFDLLREESERRLGPDDSITLLTKAAEQEYLSYRRPVDNSVTAWCSLRQRAQQSLVSYDKTLMIIRSHHIRFLRLRSKPGDLDEAVQLQREEVNARAKYLSSDDNLLGMGRTDLVVALIDRARIGTHCPELAGDPDADLAEALDLIQNEVDQRSRIYKPGSSYLQSSRLILSELLVVQAERGDEPFRLDRASKSLTMTGELVEYFWEQGGTRSFGMLKSQLARAESLSLLSRPEESIRKARQACGIAAGIVCNLDRGWPFFVLARAQRPVDERAALLAASKALAARRQIFPRDSYRITEVQRFIRSCLPSHSDYCL